MFYFRHLKDAVASVGRRGKVIHIAHSQGALLTSLATKQLSPLEMSQIEVMCFGGAEVVQRTPTTPFSRCINYYSGNDPLLVLVPRATQALRSGFVVNEEFCFLTPRVGDPITDHSLLGPTYAQALAWEGQRYQRLYQGVANRFARALFVWIVCFFAALEAKTVEAMKVVLRPLIWACILLIRTFLEPIWNGFKSRVLPPLLLLVVAIVDWIGVQVRSLKGGDDYVPADAILNQHKNRKEEKRPAK